MFLEGQSGSVFFFFWAYRTGPQFKVKVKVKAEIEIPWPHFVN